MSGGPEAGDPAPHNDEAEQALLGALLLDNRAFAKVADVIRADQFHRPVHGRIFHHIASLIDQGRGASPITLKPHFDGDPELGALGGAYLADLVAGVVTTASAVDLAHTLRDLARRRALIALGRSIAERAAALAIDATVEDLLDGIERQLAGLSDDLPRVKAVVPLRRAVEAAVALADDACRRGGGPAGITTGLRDLDWRSGGLVKGELTVLAGRPGMGKSDLALNIAVAAARSGAGVLAFSQEMTAAALGMRFVARETGISASDQRLGRIEASGWQAIARVGADLPLAIDETPAITAEHIARTVRRRRQRRQAVDLVVVDHIQLMTAAGLNRVNETALVTEITGRLKALAKSLEVAVLALSQLNRAVEQREDKRPGLADLRSSGSIEQDADGVWTLYRDEYYAQKEEPQRRQDESDERFTARWANWERRCLEARNIAEITCLKLRCGAPGGVLVVYHPARSSFLDLASRR